MIHNKSPHRAAILITNKHDKALGQNITYTTVPEPCIGSWKCLCYIEISYDVHYFSVVFWHTGSREGFLTCLFLKLFCYNFPVKKGKFPHFFLDSRFCFLCFVFWSNLVEKWSVVLGKKMKSWKDYIQTNKLTDNGHQLIRSKHKLSDRGEQHI